jgi:hypothetical protein
MLVAGLVLLACDVAAAAAPTAPALHRRLHAEDFAFVGADELWPRLASLGAREADLEAFAELWDEAVPQRDERGEAVYPHKGTLTTYYDGDAAESGAFRVRRSASEDSTRVAGHAVERIDASTLNGGGAGYVRVHRQWPLAADSNSIMIALRRLAFGLMGGGPWEAMVSAFRVLCDAARPGEPGPEGVHQDAAEMTVAVLVRRRNVARRATQGCFNVTSTRVFSDRTCQKNYPPFENLKRDDHSSKNQLKRVETDRDMRLQS